MRFVIALTLLVGCDISVSCPVTQMGHIQSVEIIHERYPVEWDEPKKSHALTDRGELLEFPGVVRARVGESVWRDRDGRYFIGPNPCPASTQTRD